MSRYTGPVCKLCRREQMKLFLKGERCLTPKCAIERRNYPPGQHGPGRQRKMTQYGMQLREKQKLRRIYGVTERVFRNYFNRASRQPGIAGENFLRILERRLDNVVHRLGFASSRAQARQLVAHGNVQVNGRKVDIPSFLVKPGMVVQVKEKLEQNPMVQESLQNARVRHVPTWLELDSVAARGKILALPSRGEIDTAVDEKVIVEFYSRMGG
mgnify:CR=1 FL=1